MSKRGKQAQLQRCFCEDDSSIEIGIDEAGRGPMLGRVYTAAVVLPKDDSFKHELMKDSKRFHSEKKIKEAAEYIKANATYWGVAYSTEQTIDSDNIRNATHQAMHCAIRQIVEAGGVYHLLVDGNDFRPYTVLNADIGLTQVPHTCIEGGDNKYTAIAAASILAKVTRDEYIAELCTANPILDERYEISRNKGYGTKAHMDGILEHGITEFHRKTFGICRQYS
tara:strand:- start:2130 stop:2801 length:672 start_codon:yes stop_codon:yes gene_type:complete